jgi:hypothetical protein
MPTRRPHRLRESATVSTHTMRHTYRSWLDAVGTSIAVQQKLMRHADIRTMMNVYGDVVTDEMEQAHSKVVRMARGASENCLSQIGRISILDCGRHNAQFTVAPPQHFLYFFPEPHGHGSFRPTLGACAEVHSGGHRKQILSVLFTTCGAVRVGRRELKHRTM